MAAMFAMTPFGVTRALATPDQPSTDEPRRDEFGVVPEAPGDPDLSLPDPVLDRTWPAPKPGDHRRAPEKIDPDEDKDDPFLDEDAPPPPRAAQPGLAPDFQPPAARPTPPIAGSDGKAEADTPVPEPNRELPDVLTPDLPENQQEEERQPSPLDEDDEKYNRESEDPW